MKSIFREQLLPEKFKAISASTFDRGTRLELPTPSKFDKDVHKYTCEARFSVDASAGLEPETALAFAVLARLGSHPSAIDQIITKGNDGPRYDFNINYSSQNVDGQHIVRVSDLQEIQAALAGAFLASLDKPASPPKAESVAAPPAAISAPTPADVKTAPEPAPLAAVEPAPSVPARLPKDDPEKVVEEAPLPQDIAAGEFEAADKALNVAYKDTMGRLSTEAKNALRAEQRNWIKKRDAECEDDGTHGQGPASAGHLESMGCMTRMTQARTKEIRAFN
ncbi:hypothetical protein A8M77_01725 [Variovorax sp. JS1663]|nr:hypothetical protein A8M77_01725 [Variovorax sp. JS1663]